MANELPPRILQAIARYNGSAPATCPTVISKFRLPTRTVQHAKASPPFPTIYSRYASYFRPTGAQKSLQNIETTKRASYQTMALCFTKQTDAERGLQESYSSALIAMPVTMRQIVNEALLAVGPSQQEFLPPMSCRAQPQRAIEIEGEFSIVGRRRACGELY